MDIINDLVDPVELTGFTRELPAPANNALNRFLPDVFVRDITVEILNATRTNRAAVFRTWDSETPIGKRDKIDARKVSLPPLGEKLVIGEYDRIQLEAARLGGQAKGALIEAIFDDADIITGRVHNRMEIARGDVLCDAKFTLAGENGLFLETDYGLPDAQKVEPTVSWDEADTAAPVTDMIGWSTAYAAIAGERPAFAVTTSAVLGNVLLSAQVKALVGKDFVTPADLNTALAAMLLPQIVPIDTLIETTNPSTGADVSVQTIDDDKVILLPANPASFGITAWGITAEALELVGDPSVSFTFQDAPGIVGVVLKGGDPVKRWTKVTGVGMPVIRDIRKLMVATVIEPGS